MLNQKGFSIAQVLVGVAIGSMVALGVAAAVSSALDGMSHQRNFSLAEEATGLLSGLMGDPNYCTTHFAGTTVDTGALPKDVATNVSIKNILENNTLGTSILLGQGHKYQNITIEKLSLTANSVVGPNRVLGALQLTFKSQSGLTSVFQRSIPIYMNLDTNKKITTCSKALEPTQGIATGLFSTNCDDFAAKGWATKLQCMQDGKWHLAYSHNDSGAATYGAKSEFINHISAGAEVKVVFPTSIFRAGYETCTSVAVNADPVGDTIACMSASRAGVNPWYPSYNKTPVNAVVYFSNGRLVYDGTSTAVNVPMDWYVRY